MTPKQTFSREHAPDSICLLRLSALGDITHVLPTLRTLQHHWPDTRITWIIGKTEYQLVRQIAGIHFIVFDKSEGFSAYRSLRKRLAEHGDGRPFDILLHMQLSIRASVASLFIPAKIKLGFDRARAKDMQSLFCNRQIEPLSTRQHVLDSFLEFPRYFGLPAQMQWQLPVSTTASEAIRSRLATQAALFVINPCAVARSRNWRNWTTDGYAAVADHVTEKYGMQVVLCGGPSQLEKDTAEAIIAACRLARPHNLVATTTIDEMVALLDMADIVLAPDTGPVHIASALNTDTIGLYAATNPDRAGPYKHQHCVVNKYPQALLQYNHKTPQQARWGERIKTAECMQLISPHDVIGKIEQLRARR